MNLTRRQKLFRDTWVAASAHRDPLSQDFLMDMKHDALADDELRPVWEELTSSSQAQLELHLEGKTIIDHSAEAHAFGEFVKRFADTVKEVAKEKLGRHSNQTNLRASFAPGSVQVTFQVPEPEANQNTLDIEVESVESQALRQVTTVLALADGDQDTDASTLLGSVASLGDKARRSLLEAVEEIEAQGWELYGTLTRKGDKPEALALGARGVNYLLDALQPSAVTERQQKMTGKLLGHHTGLGKAYFEPLTGRNFTLAVPDPVLFSRVTRLDTEPAPLVEILVNILEKHTPGSQRPSRTSYVLLSLELTDQQPTFETEGMM